MAFEPRYKAGVFSEGGLGLRMSNGAGPWYLTARMLAAVHSSHQGGGDGGRSCLRSVD